MPRGMEEPIDGKDREGDTMEAGMENGIGTCCSCSSGTYGRGYEVLYYYCCNVVLLSTTIILLLMALHYG